MLSSIAVNPPSPSCCDGLGSRGNGGETQFSVDSNILGEEVAEGKDEWLRTSGDVERLGTGDSLSSASLRMSPTCLRSCPRASVNTLCCDTIFSRGVEIQKQHCAAWKPGPCNFEHYQDK
ncbi:hypothetical protein SESBI_09727 [Sesbania bispinosa]|nr:hypothetical protein SESBI_09727 [Sesbania bispinosa]